MKNEHDYFVKRRSFLFYGVTAIGGGLLALGSGSGYWLLRQKKPAFPNGFCDKDQLAFVESLGRLYFPETSPLAAHIEWGSILKDFDGWLAALPELERRIFAAALRVLEETPILGAGWSGFSNLTTVEQRDAVASWEQDEGGLAQEAIGLMRGLIAIQVFDPIDTRRAAGLVEGCGV